MELTLTFSTRAQLRQEYAVHLQQGRAFVPCTERPELFSEVLLTVVHPELGEELQIACRVVMVITQGEHQGVALEFLHPSQNESLVRAFVDADDEDHEEDPEHEPAFENDPLLEEEASADESSESDGTSQRPLKGKNLAAERQQKLRDLSLTERLRVARGPVMADRILLERIYGSAVWEALLRNPKLSIPEVARIARKGTLPRPLLELITENENWIRQAQIRRALLSNPRLSTDGAVKILRTLPARELKLVPHQTGYPSLVRQAAQRLMKGG